MHRLLALLGGFILCVCVAWAGRSRVLASAYPFHHSLRSLTSPAVYRLLKNPLEPERVQEIITEAVDIEKSFICDSLPVSTALQA